MKKKNYFKDCIQVFRDNWKGLSLISLIHVGIILILYTIIIFGLTLRPDNLDFDGSSFEVADCLYLALFFIMFRLLTTGVYAATGDYLDSGEKISIRRYWKYERKFFVRSLLINTLFVLVIIFIRAYSTKFLLYLNERIDTLILPAQGIYSLILKIILEGFKFQLVLLFFGFFLIWGMMRICEETNIIVYDKGIKNPFKDSWICLKKHIGFFLPKFIIVNLLIWFLFILFLSISISTILIFENNSVVINLILACSGIILGYYLFLYQEFIMIMKQKADCKVEK